MSKHHINLTITNMQTGEATSGRGQWLESGEQIGAVEGQFEINGVPHVARISFVPELRVASEKAEGGE